MSVCVCETSVFIVGQYMISNPVFKINRRTWNKLKAAGLEDSSCKMMSVVTSHLYSYHPS